MVRLKSPPMVLLCVPLTQSLPTAFDSDAPPASSLLRSMSRIARVQTTYKPSVVLSKLPTRLRQFCLNSSYSDFLNRSTQRGVNWRDLRTTHWPHFSILSPFVLFVPFVV